MKLRHLEYFVAAAEELNFTHAADRLNVSQPPFSKQIQDLEGELGVNLFQRERKGVALTTARKAFLIDARGILEACDQAVKKAQRINRGELGELTVGHMAALTHDFLGQALERWYKESPGIVIDCVEMDALEQERALLDGRIAVGILVLSDRPILELLSAELLIEHPVTVALPRIASPSRPARDPITNSKRATLHWPKSDVPRVRRLVANRVSPVRIYSTHCEGGGRDRERTRLCSRRPWRRTC